MTNAQWEYLRDQHDVFAGMLATGAARFNLSTAGEQRPVDGLYVSGRFFDTLGVQPILGRPLTPDDDRRGAAQVPLGVARAHPGVEPRGRRAPRQGRLTAGLTGGRRRGRIGPWQSRPDATTPARAEAGRNTRSAAS